MRKSRAIETGSDRKALARDAGLRRVSVVSVLAGALSAYGALAALLTIAGLVAVAVNGGHDFGGVNGARLKDGTALIVVVAAFVAFMFGGYTAGRMSRRSGASNGVASGILGVVLGALGVVVARAGGAGGSLHRVALHMNVPGTWTDWRSVTLGGAALTLAAMILGAVIGGAAGERWHTKLLARAADSSYGPEAERLAESKRLAAEAESAHAAAQERVTRANAVSKLPGRPTVVEPGSAGAEPVPPAPATAADQARADARARAATRAQADSASAAGANGDTRADELKPRRRHLLHR